MKYGFNFTYRLNGLTKHTSNPKNEDFTVESANDNGIFTLILRPEKRVEFINFEIKIPYTFDGGSRIFTNGYQSWTVTREYRPNEKMDEFEPRFLGIEKKNFNPRGIWGAGDLTFHDYPEKSGIFYGYSYGYIRNGDELLLLGSTDESSGYTIITFDCDGGFIRISKDFDGVIFNDDKKALSLAVIKGSYDLAFDKYFELMGIAKPKVSRQCGYTTWYNYYTGVTEKIVERDLNAISELDTKVDIFQIDDGYERTVGDWLEPDEKKFPKGMKVIADNIHRNGMKAGLWLAPFAVTPKSHIYKRHKDWLVRDKNGKAHFASHNWGGFYALDIYNNEVRAYIRKVFDTVLNKWGYDMVKLDFLYACCIIPIHNKSRGQIMCDAMDFLRECCGDKIILGCGVPLAPAFGKVDFCRIGADVGLNWKNSAFAREDVSVQHTLMNTVFRRHLDGRAFLNDPDVFLLRDNNIKMPLSQRKIIARVNSLCGNLLFVSDDVSRYTEEQKKMFKETVTAPKADIINAEFTDRNNISIDYRLNGKTDNFTFNLKTGKEQ